MNAFESGARKVIPAVLIYLRNRAPSGEKILMIHRNSDRPGDYHSGKWNGLGGKLEADESPVEAARRELFEESGLELPLDAFRPLGMVTFPNFKAHKNEDWNVFVFTAEVTGEQASSVLRKSAEGELHWIPSADLTRLNLWAGDIHFIPYVVRQQPFLGTIWYKGQEVTRHHILPL